MSRHLFWLITFIALQCHGACVCPVVGVRVAGSSTAFDYFSKDGTRHHFAERDVGGTRLSYIEDPSGNRVTYECVRTQAGLQVARAVDGAGRALRSML